MSGKHHEPKPSYLKGLREFYFAPILRSGLMGLYLLFFLYATLFYFDHVLLALKFVWYTIRLETPFLDLYHLFWGSLFLITLLLPFVVSLCAIILPFEVHKKHWQRAHKIAVICLAFLGSADLIILSDQSTQLIKIEKPIAAFLKQTDDKRNINNGKSALAPSKIFTVSPLAIRPNKSANTYN